MEKLKTGCKPADKSKNNRQIIWQAIRKLQNFSIKELEDITKVNNATILSFLTNLEKAGVLNKEITKFSDKGFFQISRYTLLKDCGLVAPQVNKRGEFLEDNAQSRMWKAIRILKTFSLRDLIVTASTDNSQISISAADTYLGLLKKAGYVTKKNQDKNYKLVMAMNSGIKAPQIQKTKSIYDPNLNKIVWSNKENVDECN